MIKRLTYCPRCSSIMAQEYYKNSSNGDYAVIYCRSATHLFSGIVDSDNEYYSSVVTSISMSPPIRALWKFNEESLTIIKGGTFISSAKVDLAPSTYAPLPWFEPDITNFPNLIKKLKTYILFS